MERDIYWQKKKNKRKIIVFGKMAQKKKKTFVIFGNEGVNLK